jgi:hypothetical protein
MEQLFPVRRETEIEMKRERTRVRVSKKRTGKPLHSSSS